MSECKQTTGECGRCKGAMYHDGLSWRHVENDRPVTECPVAGEKYDGGTLWGVRWNEAGISPRCREYGDEDQARSMHAHLLTRYRELGRTDKPELIRCQITWQVVA